MPNDQTTELLAELKQWGRHDPLVSRAIAEIERLRNEVASLRTDIEGAAHNRFYDQRDAYFEGVSGGEVGCPSI